MKKNKLLLLTLFLLPLTGCNNGSSSQTKTKLINSLLEHVNIDAKVNIAYSFEGQEEFNFEESYSLNRDYGYIEGTTPATRENGDYSSITYYEGNNGEAIYDVLNSDNEVQRRAQYINSMIVTYADRYTNPFDYLDAKDIDDSFNIKPYKASKILTTLFNRSFNVRKATFKVNDGVATSIEFDIANDVVTYITGFDQYKEITLSHEVTLNLNYDTPKLTKVSPKTNDDENIKLALENVNDNYTLTFSSPNLSRDVIVYNTGDIIYFHNDIDSIGVSNGDILYKKNGNNYDKIIYRYESGKFIKQISNVKIETILPQISSISHHLFDKKSEGVYYLDSTSAALNAELLILNEYNLFPEEGISATVQVKDNNISSITAIFGNSQRYIVNETISNYGVTTLPSWLLLDL